MPATAEDRPLPIVQGDWVATDGEGAFQVGRVRDSYWSVRDGKAEVLMDVVIFEPTGNKVGRTSPAMGGPKAFEPAVPFEGWRRIERPKFPLEEKEIRSPSRTDEDGKAWHRLSYGYQESVRTKPVRTEHVVRGRRVAVAPAAADPNANFDPQVEASARRLAAQNLRDVARDNPDMAATLRAKAKELEDEADKIAPRS